MSTLFKANSPYDSTKIQDICMGEVFSQERQNQHTQSKKK